MKRKQPPKKTRKGKARDAAGGAGVTRRRSKRDQPADAAVTGAKRVRDRKTPKAAARSRRLRKLPKEFTAVFNKMVAKLKQAAAGRRADEEGKAARDLIVAAMGTDKLVTLADGRTIARISQTRHLKPLPAKTLRWERVVEATG